MKDKVNLNKVIFLFHQYPTNRLIKNKIRFKVLKSYTNTIMKKGKI